METAGQSHRREQDHGQEHSQPQERRSPPHRSSLVVGDPPLLVILAASFPTAGGGLVRFRLLNSAITADDYDIVNTEVLEAPAEEREQTAVAPPDEQEDGRGRCAHADFAGAGQTVEWEYERHLWQVGIAGGVETISCFEPVTDTVRASGCGPRSRSCRPVPRVRRPLAAEVLWPVPR